MNLEQALDKVNQIAQELIESALKVSPAQVHMDSRVARDLYITPSWIAVNSARDPSLQHYGGFEYVDPEYRFEIGDYVFYSVPAPRVASRLAHYFQGKSNG